MNESNITTTIGSSSTAFYSSISSSFYTSKTNDGSEKGNGEGGNNDQILIIVIILISVAIIASAVGAFLYHRHWEKKREEAESLTANDRTSYHTANNELITNATPTTQAQTVMPLNTRDHDGGITNNTTVELENVDTRNWQPSRGQQRTENEEDDEKADEMDINEDDDVLFGMITPQ